MNISIADTYEQYKQFLGTAILPATVEYEAIDMMEGYGTPSASFFTKSLFEKSMLWL